MKQAASAEHGVKVRILTPTNDDIEKIVKNTMLATTTTVPEEQKKEKGNQKENFNIRCIDLAIQITVSTVTIALADRKVSLVIEKKMIQRKTL